MREIQAGKNGESWKPAIMLYAAEAFFGDGKKQFSIADDTRRRIVHPRVVNPQRNHPGLLSGLIKARNLAARAPFEYPA